MDFETFSGNQDIPKYGYALECKWVTWVAPQAKMMVGLVKLNSKTRKTGFQEIDQNDSQTCALSTNEQVPQLLNERFTWLLINQQTPPPANYKENMTSNADSQDWQQGYVVF